MTEPKNLLVVGGGGHAHVVADAAYVSGKFKMICLITPTLVKIDDDPRFPTLIGDIDPDRYPPDSWSSIVAIGDAAIREQRQSELAIKGYSIATIVHPTSYVSESVNTGEGSVILAGAVVQTGAVISKGVIVNNNATVDHHCKIGNFSHICPGASLAGGIHIGDGCIVGTGVSIKPNCTIANNTIIGAGSAVVNDLEAGTWAGVPAKLLERNKSKNQNNS